MNKEDVLKKLQQIQADNIGIIDCHIETRKDQDATQIVFSACNYEMYKDNRIDIKNRSKLYVHKFKWKEPNYDGEISLLEAEIKSLKARYGK